MKTTTATAITATAILLLAPTMAAAYGDIERTCVTYNRRTADVSKHQHKLNYHKCVKEAYQRQQEYEERRLDREAKQSIIDFNNTYQQRQDHIKRHGIYIDQGPVGSRGHHQKTKVNRK